MPEAVTPAVPVGMRPRRSAGFVPGRGVARRWGWLLLLLAVAPAVVFLTPALSPMLLVVPVVLLWQGFGRGAMVRTPLDWPLLALLIMVLVSLWATFSIEHSLVKVGGMVLGLGLFYALMQAGGGQPSRRLLTALVVVYMLFGAGIGVVGLLGTRTGSKVPLLAGLAGRLPGDVIALPGAEGGLQPNEVAGVLLWVAPLAMALAAGFWRHGRRWFPGLHRSALTVLGAALGLYASGLMSVLVLMQSRSALVGLLGAALVMLALTGRPGRWWALVVAIALVLVGLAVLTQPGLAPGVLPGGADPLRSLDGRLEIWSRALYGIQDFALTGMGMNTFRRVVHRLYPLVLISPGTDFAHAHNTWLQVALDLGVPGLVAYVAVWLGLVHMLWNVVRHGPSSGPRVIAIGILGCLAAFFLYGLTDTVALGARPGFMWWLLVAMATLVWFRVGSRLDYGRSSA